MIHVFLKSIIDSYNRVASEYNKKFVNELDHKPLDRDLLSRFGRLTAGQGRVCDLGCGPGHISAYLQANGSDVFGIDISEGMIQEARLHYEDIDFLVGDMFNLNLADHELAGVVAFYSIVNIQQEKLYDVFIEINRVIKHGGKLFITFHIGNEEKLVTRFLEQDVSLTFYFFEPDVIVKILEESGFIVDDVVIRYPYKDVEYPSRRAYIMATKN